MQLLTARAQAKENGAAGSGFGHRWKKNCRGPPSKVGPDKNFDTKSEWLNLSCRVTWAGSLRVNLYTRRIMTLPWQIKLMQHSSGPGHLPDCPVLVICAGFPPLSPRQHWNEIDLCSVVGQLLLLTMFVAIHTHIFAQVSERPHSAHRGSGSRAPTSNRAYTNSFEIVWFLERISTASVGPVNGYC